MGGMNLENILQITLDLGLILTPTHFSPLKCSFLVRTYDIRTSFFQSAMLIIGLSAPNLTENRCDKSGDLSDSLLGISPISAFLTFSFYHSVFSV